MVQITLVCAIAPRKVFEQSLSLPDGATVDDALAASGLAGALPSFDPEAMTAGIWGRAAQGRQVLKEGDRLEWCRALTVDPKVARRERFQQQGARGTGLFARRREGGKQGY
ncbi:RnfH family protein [Variovorax boronicumulans]|uniref:RnfH family protein n=1 Tax=Variovorax boronicumulans TaxID=436515 RepID=UPI001C56E652